MNERRQVHPCCLPADHGCESPAVVRPLAFGPVGFFFV